MKKLLVMMLVVAMSMAMLTGCNTNTNGDETGQNPEVGAVGSSEEGVSDEVSENEVSEEMTLEEKIAAEMPAKLEVGENEVIVPETVTADQIMTRMEEIAVTEGEHPEEKNKPNLAAMLILNCSYMEPSEFNALVNEHFGSMDELWTYYGRYMEYLTSGRQVYGTGVAMAPEKLLFDEHLINQSEQITYLVGMYQTDTENSKEYYDMLMNYLIYNENNLFTFDCNDSRLEGSGLASLQYFAVSALFDDVVEYDTDLYTSNNVFTASSGNVRDIVEEHANQMSR